MYTGSVVEVAPAPESGSKVPSYTGELFAGFPADPPFYLPTPVVCPGHASVP
jgi:hypothetical protein